MNFPKHKALQITHNQHFVFYQTVSDYLKNMDKLDDGPDFIAGDREECEELNEIWEMHYWDRTPVGSFWVAACTLEKLLEKYEA